MKQTSIFDQDRDGETYEKSKDYARLNAQHLRVYEAMKDERWMTLRGIADLTGDPEASISARLRDFRKPRFGGHIVLRDRDDGGRWWYRLFWNPDVPRPENV